MLAANGVRGGLPVAVVVLARTQTRESGDRELLY